LVIPLSLAAVVTIAAFILLVRMTLISSGGVTPNPAPGILESGLSTLRANGLSNNSLRQTGCGVAGTQRLGDKAMETLSNF